MNWVDFLLIGLILLEVFLGWRYGFLDGMLGLVSWVGGLLLAFAFYAPLGGWLNTAMGLSEVWTRPAAFMTIFVLGIIILEMAGRIAIKRIPKELRRSLANRLLGILPGLLNGWVTATIVALLLLTMPLPAPMVTAAQNSSMASYLSIQTDRVQVALNSVFGQALSQTITILTVPPGSQQIINLPFTVSNPPVRPDLEAQMLALVNADRKAAGLRPLTADTALTAAARDHSQDMFIRGYFGHLTPEGLTPSDRLQQAGIAFLVAGENIALAQTVPLAESGFMNSPEHRANILRPQFEKVGIGIADGGSHGLMVSQEFTN